jgi:hypothetical protein
MIPFKDLQNLADKCRDKTDVSCRIHVEYWAWDSNINSPGQIKYGISINGVVHEEFDTVAKLRSAITEILNPKPDVGISVKESK